MDTLDVENTGTGANFRTLCEYWGQQAKKAHARLMMCSESDRVRDDEAMVSDGKIRETCREEYGKYLFDGHEKNGIAAFVDSKAAYVADIKCLMLIKKLVRTCSMASDCIATHYSPEKRVLPLVSFWMGNLKECCQKKTQVYGMRIFFPTVEMEMQNGDGMTQQIMPFLWAKMKQDEIAEAYTRNEIWKAGCCYDRTELEVKIVSPEGILQMSEGVPMQTMERIGGFKAEPLAARREAALIALTLKQLDGDCRELLREYAPVLVTVKVPEEKVDRSRRVGIVRPDYSEKESRSSDFHKFCWSQGRRDSRTRTAGQGSVQETEVCNLT